jgi:uncharacterized protein
MTTDVNELHSYHPPDWLPGSHPQTIFPFLFRSPESIIYQRQKIETPDGDFLHIDWVNKAARSPLVVLLHGLEGSSNSHYSKALMAKIKHLGWAGCIVHFRGCSGSPNRLPRAYHSGDSNELEWIIHELKKMCFGPLFVAGYSLGGNVLLNWLGRPGYQNVAAINAAVAISVPYDLVVAGNRLSQGVNRIYGGHFLRTLKRKALRKIETHRLDISPESIKACKTLKEFDNHFTAPIHGFNGVDDYWSRASSKPFLLSINNPTLIIHAENDPFLSGIELKTLTKNNNHITLNLTKYGGHVGYISGTFPGHIEWLPERITKYFMDFL